MIAATVIMLETRTNDWLSRLKANGPRSVSLLLTALIAMELARIAIALIGGNPVNSPQPILRAPAVHAQAAGLNIQSVISAHLFGIPAVSSASQDPANAPQSSANLVLAGTIATQDPKHGVAIVGDGGPSKVYSVGDRIGGASLHSVYMDRIILDRDGTLETVMLPRQLLAGRGVARRPGVDPN